uniref:Uncharacterized protein n=2 Tax=Ciona intestinalis TaxID=7719 RepID=F6W5V6_CIOIN
MSRCLQISSIVLALAAMIFVIVSFVTTSWMTACMDAKHILAMAAAIVQIPDSAKAMFNGKICFDTGLFKVSYSFMNMHSAVDLPANSMDAFLKITIGLFSFSLLLLLVGGILIILAVCSVSMSSQRKAIARMYNGIGAVVLFFGAIFILAGALAYTVPQSRLVHQPLPWMAQLGKTFQNIMAGGLQNMPGSSSFSGLNNLGGHDGSLPSIPDLSHLGGNSESSSSLPPGFGNLGNLDSSSLQHLGDMMGTGRKKRQISGMDSTMLQNLLGSIDPMFGYSLYLSYVAFIFALLSAIFAAVASRRGGGEYPDTVPLDTNFG